MGQFNFWLRHHVKKNVLRGFHFNSKFPQAKFVTVLKGKILDYVIDLRKKSKTFGKSFSIILSDSNCKSLYIPKGFAHAYYSFSKLNIIYYKLSNYYHPKYEDGILWNDKIVKNNCECTIVPLDVTENLALENLANSVSQKNNKIVILHTSLW